jgi:glucose-6-phosphate 1-dehydrogenase
MASSEDKTGDLLVIFGITGDLARTKTVRALYGLEQRGLLNLPIIGVAGKDMSAEQLVARAHDALVESGEHVDEAVSPLRPPDLVRARRCHAERCLR